MLIGGILSVGLFTIALWGPLVFAFWPRFGMERWSVLPQLKFLLDVFPFLARRWPGPVESCLTKGHLQFMALVYGGVGWVVWYLIRRSNTLEATRFIWLLFSWLIWLTGLYVSGSILSLAK